MNSSSVTRRLWNAVKRVVRLGATVDISQEQGNLPLQSVSYLGKVADSVPAYPYGFYARPRAGFLALIFSPGARAENKWHMVTSASSRPSIEEGEVVLFHPDTGATVLLQANGDIKLTAPTFQIEGDLNVSGKIDAGTTITGGGEVFANGGSNSVSGHIHGNVTNGPNTTNPPTG